MQRPNRITMPQSVSGRRITVCPLQKAETKMEMPADAISAITAAYEGAFYRLKRIDKPVLEKNRGNE